MQQREYLRKLACPGVLITQLKRRYMPLTQHILVTSGPFRLSEDTGGAGSPMRHPQLLKTFHFYSSCSLTDCSNIVICAALASFASPSWSILNHSDLEDFSNDKALEEIYTWHCCLNHGGEWLENWITEIAKGNEDEEKSIWLRSRYLGVTMSVHQTGAEFCNEAEETGLQDLFAGWIEFSHSFPITDIVSLPMVLRLTYR